MSDLESSPSLEEWRDLHEAALRLKASECWEWMSDSDLFGLRDPASEEVGYCCVMGALGEHFALGVYLGGEGLAGYRRIQSGQIPEDPIEALALQKCLMASFEDRRELESADREIIKQLGLKFRGPNAWPLFRSYRPGYEPWFLTHTEAQFLHHALEQTLEVAFRFREDRTLLIPPRVGQALVRVPSETEAGLEWQDAWLEPLPYRQRAVAAAPLDEARLQRIRETIRPADGVLEADFFYFPGRVRENKEERPYFPWVILFVDPRSELVLDVTVVHPDEFASEFAEKTLNLFEKLERLPREVQVRREEAFALLKPAMASLGVRLSLLPMLRCLDEARTDFTRFMRGMPPQR